MRISGILPGLLIIALAIAETEKLQDGSLQTYMSITSFWKKDDISQNLTAFQTDSGSQFGVSSVSFKDKLRKVIRVPSGVYLPSHIKNVLESEEGQIAKAVFKDAHKKAKVTRVLIESTTDFENEDFAISFKDTTNVFHTIDRLEIVYYDTNDDNWYYQQYDAQELARNPLMGDRVSLSNCFSHPTRGGVVSVSFKAGILVDNGAGLRASIINPTDVNGVIFALTADLKLSNSAEFIGTVNCGSQDPYSRAFLYPYYIRIPRGRRVPVRYLERKGLVETGPWEETAAFEKLTSITPLLECALGDTPAICETGILSFLSVPFKNE